jgi:predicted transcriptional regulator of viral defense system
MTTVRIQKLEELFKAEGPILRSANLRSAKFCSKDIKELIKRDHLSQVRRGYYSWGPFAKNLDDIEILASLIPDGIISFFSSAQYHDLTTVIPGSIEITLPASMRTPVLPGNLHVTVHKSADHI